MSVSPNVKHLVDGAAVATGALSFFQLIPWSQIAGFLSAIWLTIQITTWIVRKIREYR